MSVVFRATFDGGTLGGPIESSDVVYSSVVYGNGGSTAFVASPLSGLAGAFSADGGFAHAKQEFGVQTVRTLQRYIRISAIPSVANLILLSLEQSSAARAQVTVRSTGRFAIRNASTLVTTAPWNVELGKLYRLLWQVDGTSQTLRIYDGLTNELLATLTGAATSGFNSTREGIISNPGVPLTVTIDEATDDNTITVIPPFVFAHKFYERVGGVETELTASWCENGVEVPLTTSIA